MTDQELTDLLRQAAATERRVRQYVASLGPHDLPERDSSVTLLRHVTAQLRTLENWIGLREYRTAKALAK